MQVAFKHYTISLLVLFILLNITAMSQTNKTISDVKGISVGAKAPMFKATDAEGKKYKLQDALKKGPVVVLFYRGQWCPVCNRHLSQLQDSLQLVYKKGASVVAISPEKPELLRKTKEKTHASFTLLHDKDFIIGQAFDVVFNPEAAQVNMYNQKLNARLEEASSNGSNRLPVPATFIINKKGNIVWRQFNPDYKIRASVQDIINNVPAE
ncbi:MAG: peroxiredoxin-like family protein [Chitinophagaceae bacterium]